MRRGGVAVVAAVVVLLVVLVGVAGLAWQFAWRTRPDRVGPRFVEALMARHPGTTIGAWQFQRLHLTLPSGVHVDARLDPLFAECQSHPLRCSTALERSLDDVDHIATASREPDRALLELVIVNEPTPGFLSGYVAEPLIGTLEVRYALVAGVASTFVTAHIASRLGLTQPALREAALERLRTDASVRLEPIQETDATIYRVESHEDAPASLLDRDCMKRLAAQMKAERLYAAIPARGVLYLAQADDDGASALTRHALTMGLRSRVLAYDPAAADGSTLSFVRRR